jgi:hypothetical protein
MLPEIEKAVEIMNKQQEAINNLHKFIYRIQDILFKYAEEDESEECRLVADAIIMDIDKVATELLGYEGFEEQCHENKADSGDADKNGG